MLRAGLLGLVLAQERPELLDLSEPFQEAGRHGEAAVQFLDNSLPVSYLDELRSGILNLSKRRSVPVRAGYAFTDAFESAYTFFLTATAAGLPAMPRAIGLPLGPFLAKGLDPACNAFFLNAVVLTSEAKGSQPPWHDFAVSMHADQSLRVYAPQLQLPQDGTARTVVILYLGDGEDGGELEVYDHFAVSESGHRETTRRAAARCARRSSEGLWSCQRRSTDADLMNFTLARLRPRRGRLVHFEGTLSHAVRRVRAGERVAVVLEQFAYPQEAIDRIPTLWAECGGRPCFANRQLRKEFVGSDNRPRKWG